MHVHSVTDPKPDPTTLERDPVCGMSVGPNSPHRHVHAGREYRFCSAGCTAKFAADPERYLNQAATPPPTAAMETPAGTKWTCPMHPQIVRDRPGSCPICGMALEPMTFEAGEPVNPELVDMRRRLIVAAALTVPLLVIAM